MVLMPAVRKAVPKGKYAKNWESAKCPECGKACWKPKYPRVKKTGQTLEFICTVCADKRRQERIAKGNFEKSTELPKHGDGDNG